MRLIETTSLKSLDDTCKLAEEIARVIQESFKGESVEVGFSGNLGAGKTALIRFLVQALGSKSRVSSPSYVLQNEYLTESGVVIEHWDFYRFLSEDDAPEELDREPERGTVRLIEWPEKLPRLTQRLDMRICINYSPETDERSVSLSFRDSPSKF